MFRAGLLLIIIIMLYILCIYISSYMSCVYVDWLLAESYCTDISRCTVKKKNIKNLTFLFARLLPRASYQPPNGIHRFTRHPWQHS